MTHTCNYQLDLDGQVTCAICGAMDDDMDARSKIGYFTGMWSNDDDFRITPFLGPYR